MKVFTITLYRYSELNDSAKKVADREYITNDFLNSVTSLGEVWFTFSGCIYPIFNV